MTKEEFTALPLPVALAILYDALPERLAVVENVQLPRRPKYDLRVYRKGGYCWASEMDAGSLRWWHARAVEGANSGGPYAERDAAKAKKLGYWVEWRTAFPTESWFGTRDEFDVAAQAPSMKPTVHISETKRDTPVAKLLEDDNFPFGAAP